MRYEQKGYVCPAQAAVKTYPKSSYPKFPQGDSAILFENHWLSLIMVWKGHWRAKYDIQHTNHVVKGTTGGSRETRQKGSI